MALNKELIREAACQQWGKDLGLSDGMYAPVATCAGWCDVNVTPELERFALAIYALGVADEREKNANTVELIANGHELKAMTTTEQDEINELRSIAWKFNVCAEAIRKGE